MADDLLSQRALSAVGAKLSGETRNMIRLLANYLRYEHSQNEQADLDGTLLELADRLDMVAMPILVVQHDAASTETSSETSTS